LKAETAQYLEKAQGTGQIRNLRRAAELVHGLLVISRHSAAVCARSDGMADLDSFVSDLIREKGLDEKLRPELVVQVEEKIDDMILDNLDSESALDEYGFLYDAGDEQQLRAFLLAAIPDLEAREKQVLDDFRSSYRR
jgi:hypothetical protein